MAFFGIADGWGLFDVFLCLQWRDTHCRCIIIIIMHWRQTIVNEKKPKQRSRRSNANLPFPKFANSQKIKFKLFKLSV